MTLAEVLVATAILGLVAPAAMTFIFSMQRSERKVAESTQQEHASRLAVESLARSLREAGYAEGLSYDSSSIFFSAYPDSVTFYSDPDGDGTNERITYRLVPDEVVIKRDLVEPNCSVFPCSYSSGATTTTRVAVEYVRNGDMSACGQPGTTKPLFEYYKVVPGEEEPEKIEGSALDQLVDINHVEMTVVTDVTPGESPNCHSLGTGVSLRNWRG
jgi:type II secretory pathway component PulJ